LKDPDQVLQSTNIISKVQVGRYSTVCIVIGRCFLIKYLAGWVYHMSPRVAKLIPKVDDVKICRKKTF
jgi:hypothetical protein